MEERVLAGDSNDDPPLKPSSKDKAPPPPGAITPVKSTETYVIQIPRDQVYRIPPPENASIVESYRKPCNDGKNACGGRWIFIFLAIILVAFGTFVTINNFSNPKSPEFSITHFARKVSKSANHHPAIANNTSEFEISLHVFNPNEKSDIHYGVGNVTLDFKGHEIAYGESQLVQQEGGTFIIVDQSLHGTKGALPDVVEKSMNDKLPKVLIMKIDVPIEVKRWEKTFKKQMIVGCNLEVDSLAQGAKLLSQKCGTA